MRFKYYLRGLGIGIIVATVILSISFAIHGDNLSDAEIMRRAEKLGMVMPGSEGENGTEAETEISEDSKDTNQQEDTRPETVENVDDAEEALSDTEMISEDGTQLKLTIEVGDSTYSIARRLEEYGYVENGDSFAKYMQSKGYSKQMMPGEVIIPHGATQEEIAKILITDPNLR
ncbi:MAG: endolytic transglycosylase MltG [Lachnospiraceae bacterium]|nr:endolytic transglycosylase MltG [Lachnospiraceae bacterium]